MTREEIIASCKAGRETADIIQFVPRPNPKKILAPVHCAATRGAMKQAVEDHKSMFNRKTPEQQAAEILAGVDEVALRHQDTAPSEYVAPPEDCA